MIEKIRKLAKAKASSLKSKLRKQISDIKNAESTRLEHVLTKALEGEKVTGDFCLEGITFNPTHSKYEEVKAINSQIRSVKKAYADFRESVILANEDADKVKEAYKVLKDSLES